MRRIAIALVLAIAGAACSSPTASVPQLGDDAQSYVPGAAWRVADAERVGMDGSAIARLVQRLRSGAYGNVDALIIARRGYIVSDETFNGWNRDSIHTMQSVTKSVTSLVAGIAIARGDLAGTTQRVVDLFPAYAPVANLDAYKRVMTVGDILTMRTGWNWSETVYAGSPLELLNNSTSDWMRLVLDWPMRETPGTRWEYNSGGVILLGGGIGLAAHMNEADYARTYLLRPIGITGDKWTRGYPDLLPHSGGGLYIRTMDLARIGYLVLRDGRWGSEQVVPQAWMRESTRLQVASPRAFNAHATDYGYLWWLLPLDGVGGRERARNDLIITAAGAKGQWLFVVPRYDLVVAVNSTIVNGNEGSPIDLLYNEILPAVR